MTRNKLRMPRPGSLPGLLVAAGLALAAGTARAQAPAVLAEAQVDVDGDGTLDIIRIESPPAVSITFTGKQGPARSAWRPFATSEGVLVSGSITTGTGKRFGDRTVIVATAHFADARGARRGAAGATGEAMVLSWHKGALDKLWEGEVGRRGRDGDHHLHVEATPLGLLRYQTRPDVRRCDDQPAYLFAEGYDFARGRFRAVSSPPRLPADAPVLRATRSQPAGSSATPAVAFRSRSASTQAGAGSAGELVPPREIDDGDPRTAWRAGTSGHGRGEFLTLTTPMKEPGIVAVRILPGNAVSAERFRRSNRLRRMGLLVDTGAAFWVEFPADPAREGRFDEPYWIHLPAGLRGTCVTLVLDQVYAGQGGRGADTAISDVAVLTELDLAEAGPEAALVAQVLAGGKAGDAAARLLAARGPRATPAIQDALQAAGRTPNELLRLRRILARAGDPAAADQLVEALAAPALGRGDRRTFASALTRMGSEAVPAVAALLHTEDASPAARRAAAEVLADVADARALDALIQAAGAGDRALRQAVAAGLGHRDPGELAALLAAIEQAADAAETAREADLWRAAGVMARLADPPGQDAAGQRLAARLATATGYELPYRLIQAAAGLDHDAALASLSAALGRLDRDRAESRALRRVAAAALARNPGARARGLLLSMSADADPGVRGLAITGLGHRDDAADDTDRAVMTRLASDAWPRIRLAAAGSLARRCGTAAPTAAALARAVDHDRDLEVRRASLSALVECRAPGIGARLVAVAASDDAPVELRGAAVALIPALGDRALAPELIELFAALRKRAWSDKAAIDVAAGVAVALGRLGAREAVAPLVAAAREPSFPELQAGAITGLGEMCPAEALPLLESLRGDSQRVVAVAARGAHNRCRGAAR